MTTVSSFEEAAREYGRCEFCGNKEFEVNESGAISLSLPPQKTFTLICTHCNHESQRFSLLLNMEKPRIIVRSDRICK